MRSSDTASLVAILDAFSRWERRLVAIRFLLGVVALLAGAAAMAVLLAGWSRLEPATGRLLVWGLGGLVAAALYVLAWTAAGRWGRAGDPRRQARHLERALPALRGRLALAADRLRVARPGESEVLRERARAAAVEQAAGRSPREVIPLGPVLRGPALVAALALGVLAALVLVRGQGPLRALAWLLRPAEAPAAAVAEGEAAEERAVVGDIEIRYTYPPYTGLEPVVVPNAPGDVHGPPGTRVEVRARTAAPYARAELERVDVETVPAELAEGRRLQAAFTIDRPGTWRFLLYPEDGGAPPDRSPDWRVVVEADQAPTVALQGEERVVVAWDAPLPLSWSARDDFGIARVEVQADGHEPVVLRTPPDPERHLRGGVPVTPEELGLRPGDDAEVRVVAWDQDAVSGPKAGRSRPVRLVVMGPRGQARRRVALWRELRDALLDALAAFVTDPDPPATRQDRLAAWGVEAAGRLEPVEQLVDRYWEVFADDTLEAVLHERVQADLAALVRFVDSASDPTSRSRLPEGDRETVRRLVGGLREHLEQAVLLLDRLLRARALRELEARVAEIVDLAEAAERRATVMSDAELAARVDRVVEAAGGLAGLARELALGGLSEMIERQAGDAARLGRRIGEHLAAGEREPAEARTHELADELRRLGAQLEHQARRGEEEAEATVDLIRKLRDRLEALERSQEAIAERTASAAARAVDPCSDAAWPRVVEHLRTLAAELERLEAGLSGEGAWRRAQRERVAAARTDAERAIRAAEARDHRGADLELSRAMLLLGRSGQLAFPGEPGAAARRRHLDAAMAAAGRANRALAEAAACLDRGSEELRREAGTLAGEQASLAGEVEEVRPQAAEVAARLPFDAPGLMEGIDGALEQMGRALEALEAARGGRALTAESRAAGELRRAREALEQAGAMMARMQQAARDVESGRRGRSPSGGRRGREGPMPRARVEIPTPEEFATPEAYRRALLEGMRAEVPPEYRALKQRYFDELVRQ